MFIKMHQIRLCQGLSGSGSSKLMFWRVITPPDPPAILVQYEGSCVKWPLTGGLMIDSPAVPVGGGEGRRGERSLERRRRRHDSGGQSERVA